MGFNSAFKGLNKTGFSAKNRFGSSLLPNNATYTHTHTHTNKDLLIYASPLPPN